MLRCLALDVLLIVACNALFLLQVTLHDYSIRVERLPQDATADELVDFFGQYGEVGSSGGDVLYASSVHSQQRHGAQWQPLSEIVPSALSAPAT
jgi:hypothetical protein